jgi:hypothetical protein
MSSSVRPGNGAAGQKQLVLASTAADSREPAGPCCPCRVSIYIERAREDQTQDSHTMEAAMKLVRVGTSLIDRQGLFATIDLKKGTRIIRYTGEKISKQECEKRLAQNNEYIFDLDDGYSLDGKSLKNTARYVNHSCDPNCEAEMINGSIWIVTIKDINKGEEITYNYGYNADDYESHPCNCKAENCCGYILGRKYWGLIKPEQMR